ncbi:MAG: hypothetical protein ACREID_02185, partial [Planctomycetota bacterium]
MGTFRIEWQMALGRRGEIYRAVDEATKQPVLFRTFPADAVADARELPALPGVVGILERGRLRGRPYAVTEMLDSSTLETSSGEFETLMAPLLGTVAALQEKGFVHGHLRPHNVHVVEGRGPVIADYGLPWVEGSAEAI